MQRTLVAAVVGLALVAASCGDDTDSADEPAATTQPAAAETTEPPETTAPADEPAPATTEAVPAPTTAAPSDDDDMADEYPSAIVSLSPTATEMLYAIDAGDQVLAVDDFSNYPPEAAEKMQGISGFEPNVEAIAALEPDLIVTDGTNPDFLGQLDTLGIAHWEGPAAASFDDVYAQIEQLGAATGHMAEAAELVAQMQTDIAEVIEGLPELAEPLSYYHELDPTFFSVTSDTFIGAVYGEGRPRQHRRRRRRRQPVSAAQPGVHRRRGPRPHLPRLHHLLRRRPPSRSRPAPAGMCSPRCRPAA